MLIDSPLSDNIIRKALIQLVQNDEFTSKMVWWLLHAHSSERWLQFELAYQLNECVKGQHTIICEKNWHDIIVAKSPLKYPIDSSQYISFIELKWLGNWYTLDWIFDDINKDIDKIKDSKTHGVVLVIWLYVKPKKSSSFYGWIDNQIQNGTGVGDIALIEEKMHKKCTGKFQQIAQIPFNNTDNFDHMELIVYIYHKKNEPC